MILRRNRSGPPALRVLFDAGTAIGLTDGQLLERFATLGGDSAELAFAALVDRHGPMVWRVCRAILRDDHDAEDAFQATFLVLVRKSGSLWVRDSLGPWLHRVASRAAARARVMASRRREAERSAIAMSDRNREDTVGEEVAGLVHAEIDRLPDRYRMPVVLCDVEGRSYEEAARHLRCPVGTLKSRLARGRKRLRGRLTRHGLTALAGVSIAGMGPGASPAVPVPLVRATIRAALKAATGSAAESGVVSVSVASLVRRISMAMFWQQMRGVVGVALAAVVAIIGAGLLVRAAVEPRVPAPDSTRRNALVRSSQPPVKHMVGFVRDPEGRPVAGATVVAGQFKRKPNHLIGTTGPDGRFELTPGGDSSILQLVMAYKEGFAPASVMGIASGHPVPLEDEVLIQITRPVPFVGLVKDGQGKPIAGAAVRIQNVQYPGDGGKPIGLNVHKGVLSGTPLEPMFRTTTNVQGRFRFPNLPRDSELWLVVTAAGMGEYNTWNRKRRNGGFGHRGTTEAPAEIILAPAARVVGRVVTRFRSVKVGGLKVALQGSQGSRGIWGAARTDADGRFEFDGLDEGTANIFLMDHPNDGPWTCRAAADTELKPGRATEVQIELIRGVQVEGEVVDADSGSPVAGVGVGLYGPIRPRSGAAILIARTDEVGRYRFRLPPGETYFYIYGPVPAEYGPRATGTRMVNIPADAREFTVPRIEIRKGKPGR